MIAYDKRMHFLGGALLGLTSIVFPGLGIALACVAGVGKEIYDKVSGKGTPEGADIVYTVAGGLLIELLLRWIASV